MSRLLCCRRARQADMGAALSHPQEGEACDGAGVPAAPPTMADVIRERKKKAGGAGLGTLRRRIAAAARRPRDNRPDRGCEHARFIRSVVGSWRLAEVFLLCEELEAGAALRDLATQAELAREPANALHADLANAYRDRWWCDVELVGAGWSIPAHRAILAARCTYFRDLLQHYPSGSCRVPLEGVCGGLPREEVEAAVGALYAAASHPHALAHPPAGRALCTLCTICAKWDRGGNSEVDLDIINVDNTGTYRGGGGGGGAGGVGVGVGAGRCSCGRGRGRGRGERVEAARLRRLGELLGFSLDTLHQDMRYLLDSGEYADARLSFRLDGGGAGGVGGAGGGGSYGFRTALELPCHRVVLAARSRFFRSVMSRRTSGGGVAGGGGGAGGAGSGGAVCVDEKVLPRRFARALLHAAYTDQVDLSLIGRGPTSPSSTNSTGNQGTAWPGVARGGSRASSANMLEDAFQLYEIARFVEMPIVVQGCEDAIVEALSADTLPAVLRWAAAPHASHWVHRQAMRYLRDEFPAALGSPAAALLPRGAVAEALASPFLQASEAQALRALLRWAERALAAAAAAADHAPPDAREPNVVWHTAHSASRRGGRRREVSDAALREAVAPLVALVRLEHLPHDCELLHQAVRRGLVSQPPPQLLEGGCGPVGGGGGGADAWLARGPYRPPRCFLPYLDEIKALLEDQAVPEAEVARVRRTRYLHRIPDTLYMVAAQQGDVGEGCGAGVSGGVGGGAGGGGGGEGACVPARVVRALRARVRELRAAPPAARALAAPAADRRTVYTQIALRAVREMSLPDACAELLLNDVDNSDRERGSGSWESPQLERAEQPWPEQELADCCSRGRGSSGSLRCGSAGSGRTPHPPHPPHAPHDGSRAGTCRRETSRVDQPHHSNGGAVTRAPGVGAVGVGVGGVGVGGECGRRAGRLSAAVPDVAMAPNANTHLLTARDYFRHAPPWEYSGGGILQLDLGDGATHTPRPGSRAQRAAAQHSGRQHQPQHQHQQLSNARGRPDEDELRAAIELSVIRAYSSFQPRALSPSLPARYRGVGAGAGGGGGGAGAAGTLPYLHADLQRTAPGASGTAPRSRGTPSPSSLSASNSGHLAAALATRHEHTPPPHQQHQHHHHTLSRVGSTERAGGAGVTGGAGSVGSGSGVSSGLSHRTPSPRRVRADYTLYRQHEYRLEASYGSSGSGSRGQSPNGYA